MPGREAAGPQPTARLDRLASWLSPARAPALLRWPGRPRPGSAAADDGWEEGRRLELPLVSFDLPYEDAVHRTNGALTVPLLLTEPRHRLMMQRVMEGERLIGFLDEWPPLLSDLEGMRGTVLQVLWSRERERGVSVEAVGQGAFTIARAWELPDSGGLVMAEVSHDEGNAVLSVDELGEEDEGYGDEDGLGLEEAGLAAEPLFVPTHSTTETNGVVVTIRSQFHEVDRFEKSTHLFFFQVEVENHTESRIRIMGRHWRLEAADGSVTEHSGRGMLDALVSWTQLSLLRLFPL